ncbi:MAG: MarR family winged helix-turn-helix transcriptional regulator, partial [Erysipelothrix sp.]
YAGNKPKCYSKEEYITQTTDINDKRVKKLSLTKEGLEIYRCHAECHNILIDTLESNLTNDEQQSFMKGLDLLNQALKKYEK